MTADGKVKKNTEKPEDLASLKTLLEKLRQSKEEWFKRKEDLKEEINSLISQIKGLKTKSGSSSRSISLIKSERDACNKKVKELISKVKELNKGRKDSDNRVNPSMIKSQIDSLELKIETEAPSFDQEKKLMRQIKELKKQFNEAKESGAASEGYHQVSKAIEETKKTAEKLHKELQDSIKQNKSSYSEFQGISKKINELKKVQEDAFEKFTQFKKEFSNVNQTIREKYGEVALDRKNKAKARAVVDHERKKKEKRVLKDKADAVEEKLKKKKVLTTEDIIAFQGSLD